MKIYANQLIESLKKPVSCYILVGQDPFLIEQSTHTIRGFAQKNGFLDKITFTYESASSFDWQGLNQALSSHSLFAEKQLVEWVWQNPSLNDKQLSDLYPLLPPSDNTLFLIRAGHLSKAQLNAKWFKTLSAQACLVSHWPLRAADYPRFIAQLATQKSLKLNAQACQLLSANYEGRLNALSQLLEKLSLNHQGNVSVEQIEEHMDKQHQFDVFALQTALLSQNTDQVMTILNHFKQTKVEMTLIIWCVNRLINALYHAKIKPNEVNEQWLKSKGIWSNQQSAFRRLSQAISIESFEKSLKMMSETDMAHKTGDLPLSWKNVCIISLNLISAMPHTYR